MFNKQIWEDTIKEILVRDIPELKNHGTLDSSVELTEYKYFAFLVDDVVSVQNSKELIEQSFGRALTNISFYIGTCYTKKGFKEFKYNLEITDIETLRLQDSFSTALRGLVKYGIEEL